MLKLENPGSIIEFASRNNVDPEEARKQSDFTKRQHQKCLAA